MQPLLSTKSDAIPDSWLLEKSSVVALQFTGKKSGRETSLFQQQRWNQGLDMVVVLNQISLAQAGTELTI